MVFLFVPFPFTLSLEDTEMNEPNWREQRKAMRSLPVELRLLAAIIVDNELRQRQITGTVGGSIADVDPNLTEEQVVERFMTLIDSATDRILEDISEYLSVMGVSVTEARDLLYTALHLGFLTHSHIQT
ncbi:MAG: hypothetical protein A3J48_04640 [Candidatus Doudnabacteria bacterium RIFCSPHIGHO2_02_FULL_46_11]|uniref:Uncharacterized protein n=1 Tax=Candidatus Doudnabacteria bacterium RIFCSPHIGHO2_02_FULL_46_11 TaxID=1817832 RepID=A0A1F5P6N6_9BACT|nr:MAG: hypothetical protein A3J48_04640 [Candidatus Doudnabacteria bacterium RIFCSPHIGHO2_02_FULL_46_11]